MKSFYSLISYDYDYLLKSIASYYTIADEIFLGLDESLLTWKKNKFDIKYSFFTALEKLDISKKITIVKDNFHKYDEPMKNETDERNILSNKCAGKFIIGVDSDEIFLNALEFDTWLNNQNKDFDNDFLCTWKTVYKTFNNTLLICLPHEPALLGTCHKNSYIKARMTNYPQVQSPLNVLHYSWGRTEDEIRTKVNNWGHADEFNGEKHISVWNSLTIDNYKNFKNFHPLGLKNWWHSLEKIEL